jgi:hypothetical protein
MPLHSVTWQIHKFPTYVTQGNVKLLIFLTEVKKEPDLEVNENQQYNKVVENITTNKRLSSISEIIGLSSRCA